MLHKKKFAMIEKDKRVRENSEEGEKKLALGIGHWEMGTERFFQGNMKQNTQNDRGRSRE